MGRDKKLITDAEKKLAKRNANLKYYKKNIKKLQEYGRNKYHKNKEM
mgnify:CR=1 FL=1